ncbi:hypothetical protein Ae201684P_020540 [Aphanomyces euteiches]|uniref:Uncharacterized protein n=1 Tax=Aphanomyces euteiches TaxID=100861 RepID=A0A6G0WHI8_9STRA|nr:hypothetical protein Ae201684_015238 [Aphanomyces euteiches]KAH9079960.1 hypothetical protein Ae201684P_020540 [Aphanomyces euteiches]
MSLIRNSPNFAYRNITPESLFIQALNSPIGAGFTLARSVLGPFGSVTMKRIFCPRSLRQLFRNITMALTELLTTNSKIQRAIYSSFTMNPEPKAWANSYYLLGGNIMCDIGQVAGFSKTPCIAFRSQGTCAASLLEVYNGDTKSLMSGLSILKNMNATAISKREIKSPSGTLSAILKAQAFLNMYMPADRLNVLYSQAQLVKIDIQQSTQIHVMQYLTVDQQSYKMSIMDIFDPSEVDFELFAWLYMFDWVQGIREVVSFQGDNGTATLISTLKLTRPLEGLVTYFVSVAQPWYMVILTAGEIVWMVYILYLSVANLSGMGIDSAAASIGPNFARCTVDQVDFQLVCHSGVLEIGSLSHFYCFIAQVLGCCIICYLFERWKNPNPRTKASSSSLFLYAAAKYQFFPAKWYHHGIQYIDKASAILTGIVSLEVHATLYLFDIKTWRLYTIQIQREEKGTPEHLIHALPLLE